jgi:pimeloyl-ACP methyl ester carboxylesterase
MGGSITLQLAARYPQRVRTATLGGMGLPDPGRDKLMAALADSLEKGKGLGPLVLALTPKDKPRPTAQQIKAVNAILLSSNDPQALAAVIRGSINDNKMALSEEQVKAIKVPMLALVGADDPLRAGVDALKKQLPGVKVVVINKADHMTAFRRDEFVGGLKDFLDAHRTSRK